VRVRGKKSKETSAQELERAAIGNCYWGTWRRRVGKHLWKDQLFREKKRRPRAGNSIWGGGSEEIESLGAKVLS